jgi:hypothetical protein
MNNIYLYWVGNEYKLIKILRNMIYMHSTNGKGYTVNLINHDNVKEYIPELPDYFYKLGPAHQADFVRVYVLCDRGGIWLDSDTLVVDKLDDLFDNMNNKDGFFIKEFDYWIINGIFGTKPNTELMKMWKKTMLDKLNESINIDWTGIGSKILTDNYYKNTEEFVNHKYIEYFDNNKKYLTEMFNNNIKYFENYHIYSGTNDLYPVNPNECVAEFINKPYENYQIIEKPFQPLLVLVGAVYIELEKYSMEEILNSKRPINYFIEKSYKKKFKDLYLVYNN